MKLILTDHEAGVLKHCLEVAAGVFDADCKVMEAEYAKTGGEAWRRAADQFATQAMEARCLIDAVARA